MWRLRISAVLPLLLFHYLTCIHLLNPPSSPSLHWLSKIVPNSQPSARLLQLRWETGTPQHPPHPPRPSGPGPRLRRASSRANTLLSPATTPLSRGCEVSGKPPSVSCAERRRRLYLRTPPGLHGPSHIPRDRVHTGAHWSSKQYLEGWKVLRCRNGTRGPRSPEAEPRPSGPTSCLRIGPRAVSLRPWALPVLLPGACSADPSLSQRYLTGCLRR